MAGFFTELKRRNVFRVGIAYAVVAWLIVQVVSALVPMLDVPDWVGRTVLVFLLVGFPIALIIAWAFELTPNGLELSKSAGADAAAQARRPAFGRTWDFAIIGLLAIALVLALSNRGDTDSRSTESTDATPQLADARPTIAVLPFVNQSSDAEQDYFSDGLAEEILNDLVQIAGLRVASRTSSFLFKNSEDDIQSIAEQLAVANVLEGSVSKADDQLRIRVQLVDAATGYHLWSQSYDRRIEDIFAIQEEISESVADALSVTLGVAERERIGSQTDDLEAFDHYLTAMSLLNELGTQQTIDAIEHLEAAVSIDPEYADAWSLLSLAHVQSGYMVSGDFEGAIELAEETARRALALDSELAAAHAALGHVYLQHLDWAQAEEQYLRAIAIPSDFAATWDYANMLASAGLLEDALENRRLTRQMLPLNVAPAVDLAGALYALGENELARNENERATELLGSKDAIPRQRILFAMADGSTDELLDVLSNAEPGDQVAAMLRSLIQTPEDAEVILRRTAQSVPQLSTQLATYAAFFGEPELSVELIRNAAMRVPTALEPYWGPIEREARRTEAFKDLVRELRLVDYWQARGWPTRCRPLANDDFECD